jgi:ribosomal protein S18 acetylase RimI-like enzyme
MKKAGMAWPGYIHGLAILRKYAGQSLGREILNWAIDMVKKEKSLVRLDCMAENPRLCRYYEELGFQYVGQKSFPNGWQSNLYEMKF